MESAKDKSLPFLSIFYTPLLCTVSYLSNETDFLAWPLILSSIPLKHTLTLFVYPEV